MEKLQALFAVLLLYRHNLHMLHWKAVGKQFDKVHSVCDEYVSKFNELIDNIAEMMLSMGMNPLTMGEAFKLLNESEGSFLMVESTEEYDCEKAFEAVDKMFTDLYAMYTTITDECKYSDCVSKLDEHKYWLRVEGMYKTKMRLKD